MIKPLRVVAPEITGLTCTAGKICTDDTVIPDGRFRRELKIHLGHIYSHLNRAWHRRNLKGDLTDEQWHLASQFPNDLEPVWKCLTTPRLGFHMWTLRRPTLPISEWRIATHLDATKAVQHQVGTPAYKCTCQWCENWRAVFSDVLPLELAGQLLRIGIKPDLPTDLYAYAQSPGFVSCRITYHVVGKLLSGPDAWLNGSKSPVRVLNYQQVRPEPNFVLLAVYPHRQGHCPGPALEDDAAGELLQVDFRIGLPCQATSL